MPITVSFRTLTQLNFSLDLDENETIADVKAKVAEGRGEEYSAGLQKLIYNGKVLDDAMKVSEIGFDTSKFVVVMLTKKKAPDAAPPAAAPAPAPAAESAPAAAPVAETPAVAAAAAAAANEAALTADQEETLSNITAMGYDREQSLAALRAAFWNGDRAVEFLLNGIPDDLIGQEVGQGAGNEGANIEVEEDVNEDLNLLANMPQLNEIRGMIQQNPEMLAAVLQQLAAVNPRLVQTIQNNQQAFMDILNGAGGAGGQGAAAGGAQREGGPRRHVIHLSPEEAAAIERIKGIVAANVPEAVVVEAYFACDKNEEAAINFIFNSLDDM